MVEKWILQGTFMTGFDGAALDYSRDDIATIQVGLRPDRCILVY